MNRDVAMVLALAAGVAVYPGVVFGDQLEGPVSPESSKKAAQGQQAEIALGQLASKKATDPQVKQFGAHMIEDHQKASQEVQQLASREGIQLPTQMSEKHKQKQQQFSQLSGKEFDRAYMTYMLRNHMIDVTEFEQRAPPSRILRCSSGPPGRCRFSNSILSRLDKSPRTWDADDARAVNL